MIHSRICFYDELLGVGLGGASSVTILKPLRTTDPSVWKINVMEDVLDSIGFGMLLPHSLDPI